MLELEALYWTDSEGNAQEVSILDECVSRKSPENLRKSLGVPNSKISIVIRQLPMAFCRSVFQQWYNEASTTPEGYPITWTTLLRALRNVGLNGVADQAKFALQN